VRTLYPTREALQSAWANPDTRAEVLRELTERGISFEELAASSRSARRRPLRPAVPSGLERAAAHAPPTRRTGQAPDAGPVRQYGDTAREILTLLLDKYIERGILQFNALSELMKVQPFDRFGSPLRNRHPPFRRCARA
jgi:type I restriction enzyme R subunit